MEFNDPPRLNRQYKSLEKHFGVHPIQGSSPFFEKLNQQLYDYFEGNRNQFSLPLDLCGTPFQQLAWQTLLTIPYGTTISYQQQAIQLGNPKAVRAVASANRANKIAILIPCHRVIGKNGSMTGYGGEIWRKEYLIKLEKNNVRR